MNKLIMVGIFSLLSAVAQANIQVEVNPSQITLGQPFKLILTQEKLDNRGGIPDLSELKQEFVIRYKECHKSY